MNISSPRQRIRRAVLHGGLALLVLAAASLFPPLEGGIQLLSSSAQAQEQKRRTKRTPVISNRMYEKVSKAQEEIDAKEYAKARQILDELRASKRLNSYERATLWNYYAFLHYVQEDLAGALDAYQRMLKEEGITLALETNAHYSISQLYFILEDYRAAINSLNAWFRLVEQPNPGAYVLRAQAYFQLERYPRALRDVERAMALAEERGTAPKENWYQLLRALYYEGKEYNKAAQVLEILVVRFPRKSYWLQLAAVYGELDLEERQLAVLEAAYEKDMLEREQELLRLSTMYLNKDVPYKAAQLLDRAIYKDETVEDSSKNLELLGSAWYRAREVNNAVKVLAQAARRAENGELFLRLANAYLAKEDFAGVVAAVRNALNKGGLRRPDRAHITLGMALYNRGNFQEAEQAFSKAEEDERSRATAEKWRNYLAQEKRRRDALQQSG